MTFNILNIYLLNTHKQKNNNMGKRKQNIPAVDGIPGIMPGTGSLLPEPFECHCEEVPEDQESKKLHARQDVTPPQPQRRIMPCNKKG